MEPTSEDLAQIQHLLARYAHGFDSGDADAWAETFVEDGEFTLAGNTARGHEELRKLCRSMTTDRKSFKPLHRQHWANNVVVEVDGDDAVGKTMFLMIKRGETGGGEIIFMGKSQDRYRRVDGSWKFVSRITGDVADDF